MTPLIQGLMKPAAYDHAVSSPQLLETHISWVILTGEYAYKLKKPVDFGFVDFTTLARRKHFCEEEVRLNRRLAPDLYVDVVPIHGSPESPRLQGQGEPIEYAVRMRQFPQEDLLPDALGRQSVSAEALERFARKIATFHARASRATATDPYGTPELIRAAMTECLEPLRPIGTLADSVAEVSSWIDGAVEKLASWFAARKSSGFVRECHGDLHLGNMVWRNGEIEAFDCLEFNPKLSWTDVVAEIAFTVMDLREQGYTSLASRFLNAVYMESGDYAGLHGWKWYFAYRALVRAKVTALRLQQADMTAEEEAALTGNLEQYVELARQTIHTTSGGIVLMHGFSGSGKSVAARSIIERLPAVVVRSDAERKRLFGLWGTEHDIVLTGDRYAAEITLRLYRERLMQCVEAILDAGFLAVIDAASLSRWQRDIFRELAHRRGVNFRIVSVVADVATLEQRLTLRQTERTDPSDADIAVLRKQLQTHEPLDDREQRDVILADSTRTDWLDRLVGEGLSN
ncbi:MAG: AAA family ATPase [Planctomycetaceae bacterium]|nr:AAA family ATPase [Planctomycetaceae bacterium]